MKYFTSLLLMSAMFLSSCANDEDSKIKTFSTEAFAYDLGGSWEVNASTFVKGFMQELQGETYTALLSFEVDLVTVKGDTIKSLISKTEDMENKEEMIDAQLEAQFELDSTYIPGKYSVIFRVKDGLTNNTAVSSADFEIDSE